MTDAADEEAVPIVLTREQFLSVAAWICGLLHASRASHEDLVQVVGLFRDMPALEGQLHLDALTVQLQLHRQDVPLAQEILSGSALLMDFDTLCAVIGSLCEALVSMAPVDDVRDAFATIADDDETWQAIEQSRKATEAATAAALQQIDRSGGALS